MIRSSNERVGVMHMIDTLALGGLERVAVNLANLMPRDRYRMHLCTTRHDGPLAAEIHADVGRLSLERRRMLDTRAVSKLVGYLRTHRIKIIHAHGSALLMANIARRLPPYPLVVWHDHFGRYAIEERQAWVYRLLTRRVSHVLAVNQPLVDWSRQRLHVPEHRVGYLPNFAAANPAASSADDLPGTPGRRIVCVANLRPEKDHLNLIEAASIVAERIPDIHLILLGSGTDAAHRARIEEAVEARQLGCNVSFLGSRPDVPTLLRSCDVGVLSSASEGLPLALLEYGLAGLPAVVTDVGQCPEVLDHGRCGIVVPPRSPQRLAAALSQLLESSELRAQLGQRFLERAEQCYSAEAAIDHIAGVYDSLLSSRDKA